jgi:hypothetical protein
VYGCATVTFRCAGKARRWQLGIAIVAALSLFGAVTTGCAARGSALDTAALPQSAIASHETPNVGVAAVGRLQRDDHFQPTSGTVGIVRGLSSGNSPMHQKHQKPTKNAWMTRDRPPTWIPLSASFATSAFHAGEGKAVAAVAAVASLAAPADQDILTRLCTARR